MASRLFGKIVFMLLLVSIAQPAFAAPPADFQSTLLVGSGLANPTGFGIAPDGRIFILQQDGTVRVYKNGAVLGTPFITLPVNSINDRGLLGIAFDPDFFTNHYVYFYYVGQDLFNHVVRYDASGDTAAGSPAFIYDTAFQSTTEHMGGTIQFGPDGKIYISIGDNGFPPNAQDLSNPFGKILRVNKDGTIPGDNPYVGQSGKLPEIWANGLRNPFRFQFDSVSGKLYQADVGKDTWEEINIITKGANYGWPTCEGSCSTAGFTNPFYAYAHNGSGSSVTGGPVYNGNQFPSEYRGDLFFGDYVKGFIKRLELDAGGAITGVADFDTNVGSVVDMKIGPDGSLYYLTIFPGRLFRVSYALTNRVPVATASANTTSGPTPLAVEFSSAGSSDPDGQTLTYEWNFGDGTSTTTPHPLKTYTTKGVYVAELKVSDGTNVTTAAPITIQAGTPPTVSISEPLNNSFYNAGDTILYSGTGTDSAGSTLPDSAFSVQLIFHHNTHTHPFLGTIQGRTGQFTIPTTGESSPDTWYEIKMTAKDADGLTASTSVNIFPRKSHITFSTVPSGLIVLLDGSPVQTPASIERVVGFQSTISVPASQVKGNAAYEFESWSDGGAMQHSIAIPSSDTSYTATFKEGFAFNGQYWNVPGTGSSPAIPTSQPHFTRTDVSVDFDWGGGSPDPSINSDHFVARWIKTASFSTSTYKFITVTDDGVRLYIDNNLIIDRWIDQAATSHEATLSLTGGNHSIKMEYYDSGGNASAKLNWSQVGTSTPPPPPPTGNVEMVLVGDPSTSPYSIEAETTLSPIDRIEFVVDGSLYSTERFAPYSLFGDNNSPPNKNTIGNGMHTIVANVYSGAGLLGSGTITITEGSVTPPPPPPANEVQLVLVGNPATEPYSVEAKTTLSPIDRVEFSVDGNVFSTERFAPYSLFGDNNSPPNKSTLGSGNHTIVARVYSSSGLIGAATSTFTEGSVTPPPPPPPSSNVQFVVGGTPGSGPYSLEAQTTLSPIDRVEFTVDGSLYSTERFAPYSLFGDESAGLNKKTLGAGTHTIVANIFSSTSLLGTGTTTVTE